MTKLQKLIDLLTRMPTLRLSEGDDNVELLRYFDKKTSQEAICLQKEHAEKIAAYQKDVKTFLKEHGSEISAVLLETVAPSGYLGRLMRRHQEEVSADLMTSTLVHLLPEDKNILNHLSMQLNELVLNQMEDSQRYCLLNVKSVVEYKRNPIAPVQDNAVKDEQKALKIAAEFDVDAEAIRQRELARHYHTIAEVETVLARQIARLVEKKHETLYRRIRQLVGEDNRQFVIEMSLSLSDSPELHGDRKLKEFIEKYNRLLSMKQALDHAPNAEIAKEQVKAIFVKHQAALFKHTAGLLRNLLHKLGCLIGIRFMQTDIERAKDTMKFVFFPPGLKNDKKVKKAKPVGDEQARPSSPSKKGSLTETHKEVCHARCIFE